MNEEAEMLRVLVAMVLVTKLLLTLPESSLHDAYLSV